MVLPGLHVCVQLALHWVAGGHGSGLGVCAQLTTAMHCTAHVPRAYQGPYAFQGISSSPDRAHLPPAWVTLQGIPGRQGPGRGPGDSLPTWSLSSRV